MKPAMNINQHNYEEFFLLYVDKELSTADRQAVELFVRANPGLAVELEMLQQLQLTGDPFVFDDKDSLYRSEATEISLNNHEEQFLLYIDNELDAAAKEKVETFVLQHPAVQESFTLLKSTRLEPEVILFPGKESLYRKEEKERPVFYLRWQRVAVAAAFLGMAVLVWTLLPNTKDQQQNIAGRQQTTPPVANKKNNAAPVKTDNTQAPVEQSIANTVSVNKKVVPGTAKEEQATAVVNNTADANTLIAKIDVPAEPTQTAKGDIVATQPHGFNTIPANTSKISGDNPVLENADVLKGPHEDTSPVQQAVYKELDTEDEKKSLLLGSLEINKDKLRGFFRKAGNFFRGKSKSEDDKTENRPATNTRSLK